MEQPHKEEPITFTDHLRRIFKGVLDGIAQILDKLGVSANAITITGLIGNLAAGVLVATGEMMWGGILAMVIWPLDALDGTLARLSNHSGKYGAFIDSVTDRYSEIFLYGGLLYHFVQNGNWIDVILVFLAATGSIMVSYVRARAEALGFTAKIGLLTRAERYFVLIPGLILGFPRISLWILAVLTHFTTLQRSLNVRAQAKSRDALDKE
jgi:CDP-diacylglycerol--glycerol-3-phosphate 3-phosphatidyltransferase